MITNWVQSIFNTLNIETPNKIWLFGYNMNINSFLLLIFILISILLTIEIYFSLKNIFNRRKY